MSEPCVFCKIIKNELPSNIVFENDLIKCILDLDPINEGHILILPKIHCSDIDGLPDEIACEIMKTLQHLLKALKKCYDFPGYSIMQNGGEFCDFGHCHFHLFPRYKNDGFGWVFGNSKAELCNKIISEKIRKSMV